MPPEQWSDFLRQADAGADAWVPEAQMRVWISWRLRRPRGNAFAFAAGLATAAAVVLVSAGLFMRFSHLGPFQVGTHGPPSPSAAPTATPQAFSCTSDSSAGDAFRNVSAVLDGPTQQWQVSGEARVFEAVVGWDVRHGGRVVLQGHTNASAGQQWAPFNLGFSAAHAAAGDCLTVFQPSSSGLLPQETNALRVVIPSPPTGSPAPQPIGTPVPVDGTGAVLIGPPGSLVNPAPLGATCEQLGAPQWKVSQCGRLESGRGPMVWLVESQSINATETAWRAQVWTYSDGAGAWVLDLHTAPGDERSLDHITVKTTSFSKDGRSQVVFAYHYLGSGADLSYDIVDRDQGSMPRVVAHRGTLVHGLLMLSGRGLLDFEAKYPNGEPNCCPAYFQESLLLYSVGQYTLSPVTHVDPNSVPQGSF